MLPLVCQPPSSLQHFAQAGRRRCAVPTLHCCCLLVTAVLCLPPSSICPCRPVPGWQPIAMQCTMRPPGSCCTPQCLQLQCLQAATTLRLLTAKELFPMAGRCEGLAAMGDTVANSPAQRKACAFLLDKQRSDGGWAESYLSSQDKVLSPLCMIWSASVVICR